MKLICKFIAGSHLYGTNIEGSDEDIRGVFLPDHSSLIGLKNEKEVYTETIENLDFTYVSLKHFLNHVLNGSPNYTEWFFVNNYIIKTSEWDEILKLQDYLISKKTLNKFTSWMMNCYTNYLKKNDDKDLYNYIRLKNEILDLTYYNKIRYPLLFSNFLKNLRTNENIINEFKISIHKNKKSIEEFFTMMDKGIYLIKFNDEPNYNFVESTYIEIVRKYLNEME